MKNFKEHTHRMFWLKTTNTKIFVRKNTKNENKQKPEYNQNNFLKIEI